MEGKISSRFEAADVYRAAMKNKWLPLNEFIKKASHLWDEQYEAAASMLADQVGEELGKGRCRLIWPDGEPMFVQCVEPCDVDMEDMDEYWYEEMLCEERFEDDFASFLCVVFEQTRVNSMAILREHDRYLKRGELLMRLLVSANLGDFQEFNKANAEEWFHREASTPTAEKDGTLSLFG